MIFASRSEPSTTATPPPLTYTELNALRYAAGYVCRTVRKRIKRKKPVNVQLILSLDELLEECDAANDRSGNGDGDEDGDGNGNEDGGDGSNDGDPSEGDRIDASEVYGGRESVGNVDGGSDSNDSSGSDEAESSGADESEDDNGSDEAGDRNSDGESSDRGNNGRMEDSTVAVPSSRTVPSSSQWVRILNRGGLLRVTDDAFDVFVAIEEVVRTFYHKTKAKQMSVGKRDEMIKKAMMDEEVVTEWSIVAADMEDGIGRKLLKMVVEEWVKIRGFHFVHSCLELYKQSSKKMLQRSKGLRKNLVSSKDTPKDGSDTI